MSTSLAITVLMATLLVGASVPANVINIKPASNEAIEVKEQKEELPEVLLKIALCESNNQQFGKDGKVTRGVENKDDIGKYQINLYYNGKTAEKLGYNIYTEEGNTKMALYLYKTRGTQDWKWSKFCWNRPLEVILKEKGLTRP